MSQIENWSKALKKDISTMIPSQESINELCTDMSSFNYLVKSQHVLDEINDAMKSMTFDEGKLIVKNSNFAIDENSELYINSLFNTIKETMVDKKWSPEIGDDYVPFMLLTIGAAYINGKGKEVFNWRTAVSSITNVYIQENGLEKFLENSKNLGALLNEVMMGVVMNFEENQIPYNLEDFNTKIKALAQNNSKPSPDQILELLIKPAIDKQMSLAL